MNSDVQGISERFRSQLRVLRKAKKLTQEELAARAGMSVRHYQALESGERGNPELLTVVALCRALEVGIEALVILELEVRSRGRPRKEDGESKDV